MPETNPTPHEAVQRQAEPPSVQPLTRRGYERLPKNQRQIEQAVQLDTAELIERASLPEDAPGALSAEALVYFIRRANQEGDSKTRDALFLPLLERCKIFLRGKIRGVTKEEREDLTGEILQKIIEDIFDPTDRADFMQVRFWTCIDRKKTDAYRRLKQYVGKTVSFDESLPTDDGSGTRTKLDMHPDGSRSAEERLMGSQALEKLPRKLRRVYVLRHAFGMEIGSDNPGDAPSGKMTLARQYNCTGRTIRNWLREADRILASFQER